MWVDNEDPPPAVTCLLRASSSSILNLFFFFFLFFFFLSDAHLPFNNVGEGALSFQRRGCQLHALPSLSAAHIFVFFQTGAWWQTCVKAKFEGTSARFSRSPVRLACACPPPHPHPSFRLTTADIITTERNNWRATWDRDLTIVPVSPFCFVLFFFSFLRFQFFLVGFGSAVGGISCAQRWRIRLKRWLRCWRLE